MKKQVMTLLAEDVLSASIEAGDGQKDIPVIYGRIKGVAYFSEPWTEEGKILAALVKRLGGKVEITKEEMESAVGMWAMKDDDKVTVEVS